jgi:hypothetical protein
MHMHAIAVAFRNKSELNMWKRIKRGMILDLSLEAITNLLQLGLLILMITITLDND